MSNEALKTTYIGTEFVIDTPYKQQITDEMTKSALQYSEQLYNTYCKPALNIYATLSQMTPQ